MSKRTQGFSSSGGRSFLPKQTTGGGFSAAEALALAKVGATDLQIGNLNADHVDLCQFCGRPVAGDPKSDGTRFLEEIARGIHFSCFMLNEERKSKKARAEFDRLPEDVKEEKMADQFNNAFIPDPRDSEPVQGSSVYRPRPGDIPFSRVAEGLSKAMPDTPVVDMSPETADELAQREKYAAMDAEDAKVLKKSGLLH